ncbi:hypothetical protein [Actinomadura roseirufa]|uniref:hypothetical protein n=1 Tax=Actinomadura roseirufa TaxID=2094049 RepID=UPI001A955912|nr:hypothetical protein [Actinomadura roseirufa]
MSNETKQVEKVAVVSSGSVSIHPEHVAASGKSLYWWLFTSRRWTEPLPINVYVVEHADGLLLFDTGQDRASVTDPGYFPGGITGVMYDRLARFEIAPGQTLTAHGRRVHRPLHRRARPVRGRQHGAAAHSRPPPGITLHAGAAGRRGPAADGRRHHL